MTCSICIATYKRPQLLQKLLESLFNQKLTGDINLEIIVVDNDRNSSAKETVDKFGNTERIKLCYLIQPVQNISLTRNAAVKQASGEYIFFIDDDVYAVENWVSELNKSLNEFNADAVFGVVIPYYEKGIPEWIKDGGYFIKPIRSTGDKPDMLYTTNCMIKSELIKPLKEPFNPECGLTGGEDGLFFGTLQRNGSKFVFSADAKVYDFVPIDRGNLKYLSQRAFRRGITYNRHGVILSKNKILLWVYFLIKGIVAVFVNSILLIVNSPFMKKRNFILIKLVGNLGHLAGLFNIKYKMYKK
jgi:succinoglycan biosynthesis protein ExoM